YRCARGRSRVPPRDRRDPAGPVHFDLDTTERAPRRVTHPAGTGVDTGLTHRGARGVLYEHRVTRDERGLHQREEEHHNDREHELELYGGLPPVGARG